MGRIAELLEHPAHFLTGYHAPRHAMMRHPKSSISGLVMLVLVVLGLAWMWPEIQRYMKIRRM